MKQTDMSEEMKNENMAGFEDLEKSVYKWWESNEDVFNQKIQEMKEKGTLTGGNLVFPISISAGVIDQLYFNYKLDRFEYVSLTLGDSDCLGTVLGDKSGYFDKIKTGKVYL